MCPQTKLNISSPIACQYVAISILEFVPASLAGLK